VLLSVAAGGAGTQRTLVYQVFPGYFDDHTSDEHRERRRATSFTGPVPAVEPLLRTREHPPSIAEAFGLVASHTFGDRPPLRTTLTGGRPPGRIFPDPCWGGLAIIGANEANCRSGGQWGRLFGNGRPCGQTFLGRKHRCSDLERCTAQQANGDSSGCASPSRAPFRQPNLKSSYSSRACPTRTRAAKNRR